MRLFELTVDSADWRRYQIEGEHAWSVPPLVCHTCGSRWKTTGEAYPTVDIGKIASLYPVAEQRPLRNEAFEHLRDQLRALAPQGAPVKPGAAFGPFIGTGRGKPYDIAWHESWTMFMQPHVIDQLIDRGVKMPRCGIPSLTTKGKSHTDFPALLEPEAVPLVDFALTSLREPRQPPCPQCGRQPGSFASFIVDGSSGVPNDVDLFRARNNAAVYIATERLVDSIQALELTGCMFRELSIA